MNKKVYNCDIAIFFLGTNTALMFYDQDLNIFGPRLREKDIFSLVDESGCKVFINPDNIQFVRVKKKDMPSSAKG